MSDIQEISTDPIDSINKSTSVFEDLHVDVTELPNGEYSISLEYDSSLPCYEFLNSLSDDERHEFFLQTIRKAAHDTLGNLDFVEDQSVVYS